MILEHAKDLLSELSKEIVPGQVYDGRTNGIAVVKTVFHLKSGIVMLTADILSDKERLQNLIFTRAQFRAYFYEKIADRPSDLDSFWKDYDFLSKNPSATIYREGEDVLDPDDVKIKESTIYLWAKTFGSGYASEDANKWEATK